MSKDEYALYSLQIIEQLIENGNEDIKKQICEEIFENDNKDNNYIAYLTARGFRNLYKYI